MKEWWQTTFDHKYLETYVDIISEERTVADLRFIRSKLHLPKGSSILDLACGHGRISNPLAKAGFEVTGLDYSEHFLEIARKDGLGIKAKPVYVQGEMARFKLDKKFDAIISWYTSLGYYKDEKDNLKVFRNIGRHLKKGGLFLLDTNNPMRILGWMVNNKSKVDDHGCAFFTRTDKLSNGVTDISTISFDQVTMRWKNSHEVRNGKKRYSYITDARNYMYPELKSMLESNGMEIIKAWGDTDGRPFAFDTRRLIILAKKK